MIIQYSGHLLFRKVHLVVLIAILSSFFFIKPVLANMGNIASTYGASPRDIGSAQGLSMFNASSAGVYYNPAYLTKVNESDGSEINLGLLLSGGELRAAGDGRDGSVISDAEKEALIVGIKTDLSKLTTSDRPIYLGVLLALEDYGSTFLDFNANTSEEGQFLEYDNQPIFLTIGSGFELIDGFSAGLSAVVTLKANAEMSATFEDLAGSTRDESISLAASPQVALVLSGLLELEELLCSSNTSNCLFDGVELTGAYRNASKTDAEVDASVKIQGLTSNNIAFTINTLDAYQPASTTLGAAFGTGSTRIALSVEQQYWSDLTDEFSRDTIRDQANIEFDDIIIPRLAAEVSISNKTKVVAGLAMRSSPLESSRSPDINLFDNDRLIAGAGLATEFELPAIFAQPLRLDLGYQYQKLDNREFTLSRTISEDESVDEGTVQTDGDIHIVSGSITLKF